MQEVEAETLRAREYVRAEALNCFATCSFTAKCTNSSRAFVSLCGLTRFTRNQTASCTSQLPSAVIPPPYVSEYVSDSCDMEKAPDRRKYRVKALLQISHIS